MNKNTKKFSIKNFTEFKIQMLNWANQFNIFCFLDNHFYNFNTPSFECLLAVEPKKSIEICVGNAFAELKNFCNNENDWVFGHFGYNLKNEIENLSTQKNDKIGFADLHFFVPKIVIELSKSSVIISCENADEVFNSILKSNKKIIAENGNKIELQNNFSKKEYIDIVKKIQNHILKGDCYEVNFCQHFFAENVNLSPIQTYLKLVALSPNPFSGLYKLNDKFCICASPERYIKKVGNKIISQPIKGTSKRVKNNTSIDLQNKNYLLQNDKEKSENVMVVDLIRNDFSKICKKGTVKVDELFGVYSFPQVHQMISTIGGEVEDTINWVDIIKATFPMGSMTGAPKFKVMQLIDQYENFNRGLFSGSIGYVKPNKDFDFNVIIRSAFYNSTNKYLSFMAGSGITFYSDAVNEYEECLLKAQTLINVFK